MNHSYSETIYYDRDGKVVRRNTTGDFVLIVVGVLLFLAYIIFQQVSHLWSTTPLWVHWAFWGLLGTAYLWGFVRHGGVRLLTYVALGLAALGIAAFGGLLVYAWLLHHPVHPDWQGFWMAVQTKILVRVF